MYRDYPTTDRPFRVTPKEQRVRVLTQHCLWFGRRARIPLQVVGDPSGEWRTWDAPTTIVRQMSDIARRHPHRTVLELFVGQRASSFAPAIRVTNILEAPVSNPSLTPDLGGNPNSILDTDGYKFSMSEAGYPLRTETFYYSHRKGGWQFLPLDVEAFIKANLPEASDEDFAFLDQHGYFQGGAFRQAIRMRDQIKVTALPAGSWFYDREPVFTVTGPSALVSWLEPIVLQLHYRIQAATAALLRPEVLAEFTVTCDDERVLLNTVVEATCRMTARKSPSMAIRVEAEKYIDAVRERAAALVDAVGGDGDRLFEVGMRAVSCSIQHANALRSIRDAGIRRTSNVGLARTLGMIPVGTMGHEHVQRHGDDYTAYTAMRDKFPGFIFYLPDTFDTIRSGVPSALRAMQDNPNRNSGIRFDSEHSIRSHYMFAVACARELGLTPLLGLESGWDLEKTVEFERLRELVGWPANRQAYGYGGFLVRPPWKTFQRDDVAAVWKISRSGSKDTMKFGDEPGHGKESIPGRPVVWRAHLGMASHRGPVGYVAQEDEDWKPPVPASLLSGAREIPTATRFESSEIAALRPGSIAYSPATEALIHECYARRSENLRRV